MIPEQLDLFGGPPKPPKKIREEELLPTPEAILPEPATTDSSSEVPESPAVAMIDPLEQQFETDMHLHSDSEAWQTETLQEEMAELELVPEMEEAFAELEEAVEIAEAPELEAFTDTDSVAPPSRLSQVIATLEPHEEATPPIAEQSAPIAATETAEPLLNVETIDDTPVLIASDLAVKKPTANKPAQAAETSLSPDGFSIPPDEELYKRQYYSMRETGNMFGISHSMLRYWENEFEILQPRKNKKGDRYFRPIDIKNLQHIYHLLKVRKFTIDGAREYLRQHNKALDNFELMQKLEKVKLFLQELKAHL